MNAQLEKANRKKLTKTVCRQSEDSLQHQAELYLELKEIPFIRIPTSVLAEVSHGRSSAAKHDVSKYLCGVPDLVCLFDDGTYLCIELKTDIGKVSQGQKNWWNRIGKEPLVCRTIEEVIEVLKSKT